jgi:putative FmdB family regulatory protein
MPIYEYQCKPCNLKFEVKKSFTDNNGAHCPKCQCQAQRIFSPVPIVFKGSGFYVTDNAAQRSTVSDKKDGDGDTPEAKASKPAAKDTKKDEAAKI